MLDKVLANTAEQIAVSPDQSQYTIQNQDVLPGNTAEQQSIIQPSVTTTAINNQLSDNQDWKKYLSNPFRRSDRKTMPFWAIEDMMADPVYYATANKYGNELRQQGNIMYGAYRKADSWLGRLSDAYNVARYNLRASAARTDLSKALQSGDEEAIAKAQEIYDQEQRNIRTQGLKYDSEFWNSMMDITASMARNPEVFAIGIGAGVLSGGAATPAAVAAIQLGAAASEAAVVFADTYRIETGGVLQQLDVEHPELSEKEKYDLAAQAGLINATIEAVPMLIGAGLTARSAATLREATKQVVLKSKLPTKLATSAVFLKALGDELQKKTVGGVFLNRLADGALEGVQEVIQDAVQKATIRAVSEQDRSIAGLTLEDLNEFMSTENPLDPKYADKIDTFVNVGLGSFLLGAPFAVVDTASSRRPQNVREKLQGVQTNLSFLNGLRRWAQGSEVAKSSPETITKKLQNEIKLGTIDSKVYLDKKQVLKLMASDPDVAKALHNLDIEAALQESEENGGVVGVDFLKYEEQVIRGADDTLFQKIRDITSASPTNLSQAAFIEQLSTDQAAVEEIKRAREQPDSVYNQTYNQLIEMPGWDERSAEAYASMMQLALNRIGAFRLVSSTGEQVFQNVEIRQGYSGEQPATIPPTEQPTTTIPAGPESRYVSTTGSKITTEPANESGNIMRLNVVPDTEDEEIKNIGAYSVYIRDNGDGTYNLWTAKPGKGTQQVYYNDDNGWMTPQEADLQYRPVGQRSGFVDVSGYQVLNAEQVREGLEKIGIKENVETTEASTNAEPDIDKLGKNDIISKDGQHVVHVNPSPQELQGILNREGEQRLAISSKTGNWYFAKAEDSIHGDIREAAFDNGLEESAAFGEFEEYMVDNGSHMRYEGYYFLYGTKANVSWFEYAPKTVEEAKTEYDRLVAKHPKMARYIGEFDERKNATVLLARMDAEVNSMKVWAEEEERDLEIKSQHDARREYLAKQKKELMLKYNITQSDIDNFFTNQQPKTLHMFVGEGADLQANAPELAKRLTRAREMQDEGKSDEEIFNETHVHIGPDGRLRLQISDKDAKVKNLKRRKDGRLQAINIDKGMTLGDILEHDFLFELYPQLKNIPIAVGGNETALHYETDHPENIERIQIKSKEQEKELVSSILHEVQHAIQHINNWAAAGGVSGSSAARTPEVYERWKLLESIGDKLRDAGFGSYWNVTTNGQFTAIEEDESRAIQDSPGVKELATKDKGFADMIERLKQLNESLEYYDSHNARIRYMRLFGEAEARLTEKLRTKSQEELDALDPYGYFDVSEFIVKDQYGTELKELGAPNPKAPKNTQRAGEFTITLSPEATEAVTGGKDEAGWFRMEGDKLVIGITPNANPTTLAHEIFHMFSVSMQQAFNSGEMTEYWKKQVNNLAKMVGAEIVDDKLKLTDKQEEKAANMFLQYIKEGKIQNREVAPLFAYMQQAFTRICRALGLTGKLSKESMELFDSLFRAQNDIEEEQKLAGLIAFEKPEGADQELYDFYVGTMLSSRAKAAQNLVKKWYAIEKFKQGEKYKAKRRDVFAAIYKQAQESMVYDILRTIEDFGGDPAAALGTLTERYPDANLTLDFLENLKATTPTLEQEVNRLTEEKMEEYVRDEFKITDEELALRMSRNRDKVKALIAEGVLRSGGGMAEFEAAYKKANDAAEKQMSKTSIKRLLDKDYWNTLEARIVERYAYALANKDTDGMMEERYNQAVVNLIKIRAVGYESRVQKLVAFATKLRTNQKKDEYTAEAWDLLQTIIEKFGFKVTATRRSAAPLAEKLRAWIENQERTTFTTVGPLMNFLPMLQQGFDGTIMGMNVKMFDQLDAVLDTIDSIANKEYFLIGENEKIFLGSMSEATSGHFKNKGMKPFDGDLKSNFFHKISRWRNPEPILKAIFPESVMLKIWYPLINAKALANNKEKQWIERYRKVRGKISLSSEKHTYSNGVQLSSAEVADLFLAMGTQHAFENFCMKFGISAAQAETVVSEALTATPELENFVKEVWAIYAESTDLLNDEYQKRNNKIFVKKEPRAFTINGIQFEGGYVPETKDISNTAMPWEPQAPSQEMGDIKNEKEIVKQADGEVKSIVDNMERTLMLFARQAYLPLAFNNAAKFMNNTNVRDIIGTKASAFIDDWMQTGFKSVPADATGVARPIMSATTMAALGGRFMQGLVQLSGIIPAMIHVGASNFLGAAAKNLANPKAFIKAIETARGKSDYMKSRYEDPVSTLFGTSIGEQVSLEGGKGKWAIKGAQKLLMAYITYFDAIVSNMTWDAAYAKALDSGLTEEEATLEADSAVRITQTDSMQATRATALNSPLARALTPFSSYIMGMQSQAFALWTGNDKMKAVEFALGYIVISTLIESLAKEAGEGDDDDDKEYIERALHRWYNEIIGTVGSTAIPFANMGGVIGKKIAAGIERGSTGENEIFEKYGLSVPMIQYLDRIPTSAYNLAAGISSGDDEYFVKSMTSASGLVSRGFEKQLKKMLED